MNKPIENSKETFASGAARDSQEGKSRPDLISPFFLERMGEHLRMGAEHYGEWNWAKGIPSSRCYASLMRHLMQYSQGDKSEDHLAAAGCNLMMIVHNEETAKRYVRFNERAKNLNDMPVFSKI